MGRTHYETRRTIPRGPNPWNFTLPSKYSSDFFEKLEELITQLHTDPQEQLSIILHVALSDGQWRTLGYSFNTNIQPKMKEIKDWLQPLIETFEAQSASGENVTTDRTEAIIRNVTDLPSLP
jgi:hypothetical protein